MKLCAISDIHGQFDKLEIEKSDILLICGDIVPLNIQRSHYLSLRWFINNFMEWCMKQDVEEVYFIGGNHDFFLEKRDNAIRELIKNTNIHYLNNSKEIYVDSEDKCWNIWGSPMCHIFGNWAFMYDNEYEKNQFSKMPDNLDILITHDAAYGRNDIVLDKNCPWYSGKHIGNSALAEVLQVKKPFYHFTGHIHTSDHNINIYNNTKTACVSLLDENYKMVYSPLYLTL